ncbi:hypothetical protein D3C71_1502380 [compost metagenome]
MDRSDAEIRPAIPPAPIRISTVAVILLRPEEVYCRIFLLWPIASIPTIPAIGRMYKASTLKLANASMPDSEPIGLIISRMTATSGATMALPSGGYLEVSMLPFSASSSVTIFPFFFRSEATITVTIRPHTAGISPASIT